MATITPTLSPTKLIHPWAIDVADIIVFDTFDDPLRVSHGIGVSADNVTFELFNDGCAVKQPKESPTAAINMVNETIETGAAGFDIVFFSELLVDDTGGFVTFNDADFDSGSIDFCTRTSTYNDDIIVAYRDTGYSILFDITVKEFGLVNVSIITDVEDTIITEVNTGFLVLACQCTDFTCDTSSSSIAQNDPLVMCIFPSHEDPDSLASVSIANFDLTISGGADEFFTEYTPVSFGVGGWDANTLTTVTPDPAGSGYVEISTPIIATFYALNFETVNVAGSAFLEFTSAGAGKVDTFIDYGMDLELNVVREMGCMASIVQTILGHF